MLVSFQIATKGKVNLNLVKCNLNVEFHILNIFSLVYPGIYFLFSPLGLNGEMIFSSWGYVAVTLSFMFVGGCTCRAPMPKNYYDDTEFYKDEKSLQILQYMDAIHGRAKREFLGMNFVTYTI